MRRQGWSAFLRDTFRAAELKSKGAHQGTDPEDAFGEVEAGRPDGAVRMRRFAGPNWGAATQARSSRDTDLAQLHSLQ